MAPDDRHNSIDPRLGLDRAQASVGAGQRELLRWIVRCDDDRFWLQDGARDYPAWISARLGISNWAARRWITAAHALEALPRLAGSLEAGSLSFDKALELARFATADTEEKLIKWARKVTVATVRAKADLANQPPVEEIQATDRERRVEWWFEDDRFNLLGSFPSAEGAVIARSLDRHADRMKTLPEDDAFDPIETRRADALYMLASQDVARDADPDRATVVVHADLEALTQGDRGCEIEGGPAIHPEVARRLSCDSRIQVVVHDRDGQVVGIGRTSRNIPDWLRRQLRQRDRTCTFPGCEAKRFTDGHHIKPWEQGGETNLDNLVLVCRFHHKQVHEYGWTVKLGSEGAEWFDSLGRRFEPGPARPPQESGAPLSFVG